MLLTLYSHFENNEGLGGIIDDVAALYAYRTSVYLYNGDGRATTFVNNTGGGVEVTLGLVAFQGRVEFKNNRAIWGGGMRLTNHARVRGTIIVCTFCDLIVYRTT